MMLTACWHMLTMTKTHTNTKITMKTMTETKCLKYPTYAAYATYAILSKCRKFKDINALWQSFNGRCNICISLRIFNFASHFIRVQIFQIHLWGAK